MGRSGPKVSVRASDGALGKYELLTELGGGGTADVFLALLRGPSGFRKLVVLKVLRASRENELELIEMFRDEARLCAQLSHPNVVQIHEVGEVDGHHFIAMEYLDGQPLSELFYRRADVPQLPLRMKLRVLADALAGLHYAHEATGVDGLPLAIIHRDVSPHNVFVTYDGVAKVLDFGIAKASNGSARTTSTGIVKGKLGYMAPEQMEASSSLDRRADIYSMGVLLWEAATGRRMWDGESVGHILSHVGKEEAPLPSVVKPGVPKALDAICRRALAPARDARYPTALDLQSDVEALLADLGEPLSMREVGVYVAEICKVERGATSERVKEQLKRVEAGASISADELDEIVASTRARARPEDETWSAPRLVRNDRTSSSAVSATQPKRRPATSPAISVSAAIAMGVGAFVTVAAVATVAYRAGMPARAPSAAAAPTASAPLPSSLPSSLPFPSPSTSSAPPDAPASAPSSTPPSASRATPPSTAASARARSAHASDSAPARSPRPALSPSDVRPIDKANPFH